MRELGKGATARVYLIERITDNRHFAAKIMPLKAESKDYVLCKLFRKLLSIRAKF